MIKAKDAIAEARRHIGTPYGTRPGELDCINLIKMVIRSAPGGVKNYTTAGTNSLWRSYDMSAKYKDLTWRRDSILGAKAGDIAFKADGEDFHHAGIVTEAGTVVHASSAYGETVETPLTAKEGWTHLAVHRYIDTDDSTKEEETMDVLYKAKVITQEDPLTLRNAPKGDKIGALPIGATVDVLVDTGGDWLFVRLGSMSGYAAKRYLARTEEEPEIPNQGEAGLTVQVVITDEAGNTFRPVGTFTVDIEMALDVEPLEESESID